MICSKFIPNFFNRNKCQNCFKLRNCHLNDQNSSTSLENSLLRTIVRCSFLFDTPECHSYSPNSQPSSVRKFQRRWFQLWSDGELTYSLDQSSLTLPQNRIQLTECTHIAYAPEIHEYAIAINYLDKVYYIRTNNSRDELQRWLQDLLQFIPVSKTNSSEQSNKQCVVVDAIHKIQLQQQCDSSNPVFKLLSYVNENSTINKIDSQQQAKLCSSKSRNKSLPDLRLQSQRDRLQETKENHKSGYLMRRRDQNSKEWYRHYFVLKNTALRYYRDRSAATESNSLLDGVFDLSLIKRVYSTDNSITLNSSPNSITYYPFYFIIYNGKEYEYELATLSQSSRDEWIRLITNSSRGICSNGSNEIERPTTKVNTLNSDAETAELSSDSNESSTYGEKKHPQMPGSPPLNRNAISRMKHKLKDNKHNGNNVKLTNQIDTTLKLTNVLDLPSLDCNNLINGNKIKSDLDMMDSGLASSDDLVNVENLENSSVSDQITTNPNQTNPIRQQQVDPLESIEFTVDSTCTDSELNRIKFSIVELHKFCLNIISELQLTHSDLTQIKQSLIQKDFFSLLLSNQLLNGSNNFQIDTFTGQLLDTLTNLVTNLTKQQQSPQKTKSDQIKQESNKSINLEQQATLESANNNSTNNNRSNEGDESDRIFLTRKQFDSLLNKNEQLEQQLSVSHKTVQKLKTELKESYTNYDHLEILFLYIQNKFRSILKIKQDEYELMKAKINYLTSKLLQLEKDYRTSYTKLAELEQQTTN